MFRILDQGFCDWHLRTGLWQVFEVGKNCKPEDVLKQVWANFDKEIQNGNESARHVRDSLRLLACGGDGTIAWLLSSVK